MGYFLRLLLAILRAGFGGPANIVRLPLLAGLLLQTMPALAVPPFGATQCAADRMFDLKGNTSLGCTAADVSITRIAIYDGTGTSTGVGNNTTSLNACISGANPHYDFDLTINFATPQRWDIGIFLVNDGKDPHKRFVDGGPASCSVDVLTTPAHTTPVNPTPVFQDLDGVPVGYPQDWCGDGSGAINGGTGLGHHRMNDVQVSCEANPLSQGKLVVPFVVTWDNQATPSGGICTSYLDPVPNTVSKCNSPDQSLPADVVNETLDIVVVPLLEKDDGKTVTSVGETNVYDITINNTTGIILTNTMFTDPAVSGLAVSSVVCSGTTNGGVCPAPGLVTVANLQGGGISLPDQPDNSTLTFTVTARVTSAASGSITNTARVTVTSPSVVNPGQTISGYSEVSDTDTLGVTPTLTLKKSVLNDNAGTLTPKDFVLTATNVSDGGSTTLSGAPASSTSPAIAVATTAVPAGKYTLSETTLAGDPVTTYLHSWSCDNGSVFAPPSDILTLSAGENAVCTLTNSDAVPPSLTIYKVTKGANSTVGVGGPFSFTNVTNATNVTGLAVTTSAVGFSGTTSASFPAMNGPVSTVTLDAVGAAATFRETLPDTSWVITGASCIDNKGGVTGNGTGSFNITYDQTPGSTGTWNTITIPAGYMKSGADLACTVTNSRRTLVSSVTSPTTTDTYKLDFYNASVPVTLTTDTALPATGAPGNVTPVVNSGSYTLTETDNMGKPTGAKFNYFCTDANGTVLGSGSIAWPGGGGASLTGPNPIVFPAPGGATLDENNLRITCTLKNANTKPFLIIKSTAPTTTDTFSFTKTAAAGKTAFDLLPTTPLVGSNNGVSNVFASAPITGSTTDTYTVTETIPDGWILTAISCYKNGVAISGGTLPTTPPLDLTSSGDDGFCFFSNSRRPLVTVRKTLIPATDTNTFDLKLQQNAGALTTRVTGADGATWTTPNTMLTPGDTVMVGEQGNSGNLVNYDSTLVCTDTSVTPPVLVLSASDNGTSTFTAAGFTVKTGQIIDCVFTNSRRPFLTVEKEVVSLVNKTASVGTTDNFIVAINNGGPSATTTFDNATSLPASHATGKFTATAGTTYTLSEIGTVGSDLGKYDITRACIASTDGGGTYLPYTPLTSSGSLITLTPSAGEDIECTFTNTAKAATVTLSKTTIGDYDAFDFEFQAGHTDAPATVTATTGAGTNPAPAGAGIFTVNNGNLNQDLTIQEKNIPVGWTLTDASCSGLYGADTIDKTNLAATGVITIPATSVIAGANIQCNFTNKKDATITVKKTLIPDSDSGTFDLHVNGTPVATGVGDNGMGSITVLPGTVVSVSEQGAVGTDLNKYSATVTCKDTKTGADLPGLAPADNIRYTPTVPAVFTAPSVIPSGGQEIECTFSNSLQPKLRLIKEVVGIANMNDQFTISISPSANTGATVNVDAIDGTRGTATVTDTDGDGTHVYTFSETDTDNATLAMYDTTHICTNAAAGSLTDIPDVETAGTSFQITPVYGDDIVCTFKNVAKNASIVLKKALSVARDPADNQFKMQIKDGGTEVAYTTNVTSTGTGTALDPGTGIATFTTTAAKTYTLGETILGTPGGTYGAKIICTNNDTPVTTPPLDGSVSFDPTTTTRNIALNLGDNYVCTLINSTPPPPGAPLTITKTTVGGTASFNFTVVNGATTLPVVAVDTASSNPETSATQTLPNIGSSATVSEAVVPGWAITSASCTDDDANPAKWPAIGQVVTIPAVESGKTYTCGFTNTLSGFSITGTVFRDSGTGVGGIANNGIKDGAETGISKTIVRLTDCGATVYDSTTTDNDGNYSLSTLGVPASPPNVCIEETNVEGYISTGAGFPVLAPVATYDRSTDRITFSLAADTNYSGMNFGDVPLNRFLTNGAKTGTPGSSVSYPHIFVAGSGGKVSFSLPGATAMPVIAGWSEVLYRDVNCDGVLDAGAGDVPIITTPITEITVAEGERICLIQKEFIPANAPVGASNLVPITADFTYTNAAPALTASYTRQDVTQVTDVALELLKAVRNLTTGDAWGISNTAKSGDILEYRITYVNNGPTSIQNLVFNDATSAYTVFVSAACGISPPGLTCTTPVPVQPSVDSTGGITWTFTGSLVSGESGTVTYQVKVE